MKEAPEIEVRIVKSTEEMEGIGEIDVPADCPCSGQRFVQSHGDTNETTSLTSGSVRKAMA